MNLDIITNNIPETLKNLGDLLYGIYNHIISPEQ